MERSSVVDIRKMLAVVDVLKNAGVLFVPVPVFDEEDSRYFMLELMDRLDRLDVSERKVERQTTAASFSPALNVRLGRFFFTTKRCIMGNLKITIIMAVLFFAIGLFSWVWEWSDKGATSPLWALPLGIFVLVPSMAAGIYVAHNYILKVGQ